MLNTFMAAFLLHRFEANKWWWIGFIIVCLIETLYEINKLDNVK